MIEKLRSKQKQEFASLPSSIKAPKDYVEDFLIDESWLMFSEYKELYKLRPYFVNMKQKQVSAKRPVGFI